MRVCLSPAEGGEMWNMYRNLMKLQIDDRQMRSFANSKVNKEEKGGPFLSNSNLTVLVVVSLHEIWISIQTINTVDIVVYSVLIMHSE